jgi:hypothetical protein
MCFNRDAVAASASMPKKPKESYHGSHLSTSSRSPLQPLNSGAAEGKRRIACLQISGDPALFSIKKNVGQQGDGSQAGNSSNNAKRKPRKQPM